MSFILDALKKSETDRQRQDAPGIASIPASGQRKSGSKWVWIIAGLLAINIAVLSMLMLGRDAVSNRAAEAPLATGVTEPAEESFTEIVREAKRNTPTPAVAEPAANGPVVAAREPAPETLPVAQPVQPISEGLPTFNDLRAKGVLQLPDMHLDIHVYSSEPADRFVFVNMSKYTENAILSEGPSVREITGDGVVLDYQGIRFLLPRE